ncbi:MAG TPA: hypothetical protein V6C72_05090 [Chroococcales cyanobacterium]
MSAPRTNKLIDVLVQCQEIYDSTGSIEECLQRFPEFRAEIAEYFAVVDWLRGFDVKPQSQRHQAFNRRSFLAAVTEET